MRLISAPRNLLISLTSVRGAKILQTVRKLSRKPKNVGRKADFKDFSRSGRP